MRNIQHETLRITFDIFYQSQHTPSPYTVQILFSISVGFLTFVEILKHSMPKMLLFFSSIFNIMMSTQKFASSGKVFFKSQLSQNNLTKFFRIKLKITKCYRAINGKN